MQESDFSNSSGASGRPNLADLPDKLLSLLRASPAGDIEQHLKALVSQVISKLDLVTREEFELQQAMVEKLRERIEKLEADRSSDQA